MRCRGEPEGVLYSMEEDVTTGPNADEEGSDDSRLFSCNVLTNKNQSKTRSNFARQRGICERRKCQTSGRQ